MTLNRLLNADNECVGYFTDDAAGRAAMQAARAEWAGSYRQETAAWINAAETKELRSERKAAHYAEMNGCGGKKCRSIATPIKPLELEDVEPGDGDRVDYVHTLRTAAAFVEHSRTAYNAVLNLWYRHGAVSVEVQRHEINRYRRPGKSNRDAELGGPEQAAGVLYVLTIKAPK